MRALRTHARWVGGVLRETVEEFIADRATLMGAAVAFYAVLALAPLLMLVIGIAGFAFGETAARAGMEVWINRAFEGAAAQVVRRLLQDASSPELLTLSGIFGIGLALYYTNRLFDALQHALNQIWNVPDKPSSSMKGAVQDVLRKRSVSFIVMIAFGLLLLASLALETVLAIIAEGVSQLPGSWYVYRALVVVGSAFVVGLAVAVVYRLLPSVRVRWHYIWGGAMITGTLLVLGKLLLGLYLGSGAMLTAQGAAGSVFALLLWIYYSAQVFFFGAELTQVVARRRGHGFGFEPLSTATPPAGDDDDGPDD